LPALLPLPSFQQSRRCSLPERAASLLNPLRLFYGIRPNYRILYMFGSVRYFCWTIESSDAKKSKCSNQSHTDIALCPSDYTNGMMFWDPATSRFSVSPDYSLNPTKSLADTFQELPYNGGFTPALVSGNQPPKEPFPPGAQVYAMIDN
jgi:hypothetical protein